MGIALLLAAAACAGPLALLPVTPLLASALGTRSPDEEIRKRIVEMQSKGDWAGLERLAADQLRTRPSDEDNLILLGYARLQQGKYAEALEPLTVVTSVSPEEIDGWNLLGEAQRQAGQRQQALRTLTHAMTVDPSSAVAPFVLGEILLDMGRPDEAIPAYRQSVQLEPSMASAWYGLGISLKRTGAKEETAKVIEVLQKIDAPLAERLRKEN